MYEASACRIFGERSRMEGATKGHLRATLEPATQDRGPENSLGHRPRSQDRGTQDRRKAPVALLPACPTIRRSSLPNTS